MNTNGDILCKYIFTHNPYGQKCAPHFKHSLYFPSKVSMRLQFNSLESSSVAVNLFCHQLFIQALIPSLVNMKYFHSPESPWK